MIYARIFHLSFDIQIIQFIDNNIVSHRSQAYDAPYNKTETMATLDTGQRHTIEKKHNTTQKTRKKSNTDLTKNMGMNPGAIDGKQLLHFLI